MKISAPWDMRVEFSDDVAVVIRKVDVVVVRVHAEVIGSLNVGVRALEPGEILLRPLDVVVRRDPCTVHALTSIARVDWLGYVGHQLPCVTEERRCMPTVRHRQS